MPEATEERLNVYDATGGLRGAMPRAEARRSGLAVGAVNLLLVNGRGEVLLQRRPADKENGGLWDKSVGGHVSEGETFGTTAVREAGEELFGDAASPRVRLAPDADAFAAFLATADLREAVVFRQEALVLNLRDVRHAPEGEVRNVLYHVAVYLGRTDAPLASFRPPADEIAGLRYSSAAGVDAMLLGGELAPNMALLWLGYACPLLALAGSRGGP